MDKPPVVGASHELHLKMHTLYKMKNFSPGQIEHVFLSSVLYFHVTTVIWHEYMFFNILEDIFVQSSAAFSGSIIL